MSQNVEIVDSTSQALEEIRRITRDNIEKFALKVQRRAKEAPTSRPSRGGSSNTGGAPIGPDPGGGNLRSSIAVAIDGDDVAIRTQTGTGGKGYGAFVHEPGVTRNWPGDPFILRNVERELPDFERSGPWAD